MTRFAASGVNRPNCIIAAKLVTGSPKKSSSSLFCHIDQTFERLAEAEQQKELADAWGIILNKIRNCD
jgi:hypothetical protein